MNPDELLFDLLKENGIQPVFETGNYDVVFKYGAKSTDDWLSVNSPFMWHMDCNTALVKKALSVSTMTMDKISIEAEKGNYLLQTIK